MVTQHPNYLTEMATDGRTERVSIESFGFVSEAEGHLYRWMCWVVVRNLPLCEVVDPLTWEMSRLRPTCSKTFKGKMQVVPCKLGKYIEEEMEESFGVLLGGWTHGSTHYGAVFRLYMFNGTLQRRLLSMSPLDDGSQTADVQIDHFKRVLDLYNKVLRMVLFIVHGPRDCDHDLRAADRLLEPPAQFDSACVS
ncbi:hypothetical protein PR001_g20562 [Phytophthora rubi]|nr:hypothetical protein PR001_g20562 [Phytophthora rubi]